MSAGAPIARCSCGTVFIGPASMMGIKLMVGHWRQGCQLRAESPETFAEIERAARVFAQQEEQGRAKDEQARRAAERLSRWRSDPRFGSLFR